MQTTAPDTGPATELEPDAPFYWLTDRSTRMRICADVVAEAGPTIVRTRSIEAAAALADQLCRRGVPALHYGVGRGTARRDFRRFVEGNVPVLVTSGGLADLRFLLSGRVRCVIFYDPSDQKVPVARGAVRVTLVVPERGPEVPAGIEPGPPDLLALRDALAESSTEDLASARSSWRPRLGIPRVVEAVRDRMHDRIQRNRLA